MTCMLPYTSMEFSMVFIFPLWKSTRVVVNLSGNSVVLLVIAVNKTMHTTTNFFIASMALSDVIFIAFGVPLNIYVLQAEQGWKLGSVTCSLFWYLMYVSGSFSHHNLKIEQENYENKGPLFTSI